MALTPDEERRIEELLAETYNEGVREGTRNSLFRIIESTARRLLQEDFSAAARLLDRVGLQALRQALAQEIAENWIPRWVRRMVPVLEASMREITRPRERDLGQRFTVTNPAMREYLDNYVLELAGKVTETTRRKVENIVSEAIEDGSSTEETAKRIRDVSEQISDTRAHTIARTELNRSSNTAAFLQALESGVISDKIWHNAGDRRVRDAHERMEGESVQIGSTFSNGLLFPSEVNCFVPETKVEGAFVGGLRAEFVGEVVEIRTAGGCELTVTPNHPILTPCGFVPAGEFSQGQHLLAYCEDVGRGLARNSNEHEGPSRIEDVFASLRKEGTTRRRKPAVDDLHGDAVSVKSDIEVVWPNRMLLADTESTLPKFGGKSILEHSAPEQPLVGGTSSSNLALQGVSVSSPCYPGGFQLAGDCDGIGPEGVPLEPLCVGSASNINASLYQTAGESRTVDPEPVTDALQGFAREISSTKGINVNLPSSIASPNGLTDHDSGILEVLPENVVVDARFAAELMEGYARLITVDQVVQIRRRHFSGHVYDLQSVGGWIIAGGIVTSNCRCWLEFVPDFEALERKRDEEEDPDLSEAEQAVVDILAPDGELIGEPSEGRSVRKLPGGLPAAQAMFDELSQYGRPIQGQGMPDGGVVQIAPKQTISYRPSSKKGAQEPTINVTIEALPDLRKLKFVDE